MDGASALHGVSVYASAFAGTKLYCFVTEAYGCEQLAQGRSDADISNIYYTAYNTTQLGQPQPRPL